MGERAARDGGLRWRSSGFKLYCAARALTHRHGAPVQLKNNVTRNTMGNVLIHESRRIVLPFDTLVEALIELEVKHGRWPANATVTAVTVENGTQEEGQNAARSIVLSIRPPRETATVERVYTLPLIGAAIVNYCLTMRVPMPRSSTKTIQILPEGVALLLENTLMLQRRHPEPPPVKITSAEAAAPIDAGQAGAPTEAAAEVLGAAGTGAEPSDAAAQPQPLAPGA